MVGNLFRQPDLGQQVAGINTLRRSQQRVFSRVFYTEVEAISSEDDERSSDGGSGSSESDPGLGNGNGCPGEGDECQGMTIHDSGFHTPRMRTRDLAIRCELR